MSSNKTIFISPIDWGLGHATRCVPIINALSKNNKVIIGVTPLNHFFFEGHFPSLEKIILPSYNIRYSKVLPVWLKILFQAPKIISVIKREKKLLDEIIARHHIDVVISDNRFGLSSKKAECIFVTHQLRVKAVFFSGLVNKLNSKYIHGFGRVWVPDHMNKNERLSGLLSDAKNIRIPVDYIGPKSHLEALAIGSSRHDPIDCLVLLSGIEPQRSRLEDLLFEKLTSSPKNIVVVRGSDKAFERGHDKITVINFAFGVELKELVMRATTVICRSGYSTLMDMHLLHKKKIILIPTPGQTEQEYLAAHWQKNFNAKVILQRELKSKTHLHLEL